MVTEKQLKYKRAWAVVIGSGLALSPIHNQWLTELVTDRGEVGFFVPAFGTAIWLMGALCFVLYNWGELDWGDKKLYIPLLVIVASMGVSGLFWGDSVKDKLAPMFMGFSLFAIYAVARYLGAGIFRVLGLFVIISAVIAVVCGLLNPGQPTGGLITNYCASAGFLIFGTMVNQGKWQWVLLIVASIGLFFVGALEALFIVGVLGIVFVLRRDWNYRFVIIIGILVAMATIWAILGYIIPLYEGNRNLGMLFGLLTGDIALTSKSFSMLLSGRWEVIVGAMRDLNVIGHGYSLSTVGGGIIHNVPLIITHQIGPLAAVAWVFVTIYCLIRTKWKYAWVAVVAMSIFDHYLWTQFVPYWWVLIGVSTASTIKSDLIFRKNKESL